MLLRLIQILTAIIILLSVLYRCLPSSPSTVFTYSNTKISDLLAHSRDYDSKPVSVTGIVLGNAGIFGYGGYKLKQGDSEILVITTHGIPPAGSEVVVSGIFKHAFTVNNFSYPVIVEK
jgi:hypothetical protein